MSPSELTALAHRLDALATEVTTSGAARVSSDELRGVLSGAIRLYAATCEHTGTDLDPIDPGVSTTDAVVLACALLKARELNPFDLALWFSRARAGG